MNSKCYQYCQCMSKKSKRWPKEYNLSRTECMNKVSSSLILISIPKPSKHWSATWTNLYHKAIKLKIWSNKTFKSHMKSRYVRLIKSSVRKLTKDKILKNFIILIWRNKLSKSKEEDIGLPNVSILTESILPRDCVSNAILNRKNKVC